MVCKVAERISSTLTVFLAVANLHHFAMCFSLALLLLWTLCSHSNMCSLCVLIVSRNFAMTEKSYAVKTKFEIWLSL